MEPRLARGEQDPLTAHDGETGARLAAVPLRRPHAFALRGDALFVLHEPADGRFAVARLPLRAGLPAGDPAELFDIPAGLAPTDLAVDSQGRFYVADPSRNHAWRLSAKGREELRFGRADAQRPGAFDPETFLRPTRLAVRRGADGRDRLLVVEVEGPNRLTEWDCETGALLRAFPAWQTFANNGWGVDPDHPELAYVPGHGGWLVRWRIDAASGAWTVDAVWPGLRAERQLALNKLAVVRAGGRLYFASEVNGAVYRLSDDGRAVVLSAALLREGDRWLFWSDADGDGAISDAEKRPCDLPPGVLTYHGQKWLPGLSYLAVGQGTRDVWRLDPDRFDAHGNPVFSHWTKVLEDPVFAARRAGTATALDGAHELADAFTSDWMQADASPAGDVWVQARGGRNFSANFGAQHKISHYAPDGKGGMRLVWRAGRTDLLHDGARGAFLGAMRIFRPIGGLLSVIDQTRSGVLLFTEDGLYIDTLFAPETFRGDQGVYRQGGEFFVGTIYGNRDDGAVYYAAGKCMPLLYRMEGWTLAGNPVRRLDTLPASVPLRLADIADPPEMALALRDGAAGARVATFAPAFGGADLRGGSMRGWEDAEPIRIEAGEGRSVEVRPLWTPDALLLRWHVRTGASFDPPRLADPCRLFAHDQGADTLSFHFQGDPDAPVPGPDAGRPGDVRLVFGLFRGKDGAVAPLGMAFYPEWTGPDAHPVGFKTPVGETRFAHAARILPSRSRAPRSRARTRPSPARCARAATSRRTSAATTASGGATPTAPPPPRPGTNRPRRASIRAPGRRCASLRPTPGSSRANGPSSAPSAARPPQAGPTTPRRRRSRSSRTTSTRPASRPTRASPRPTSPPPIPAPRRRAGGTPPASRCAGRPRPSPRRTRASPSAWARSSGTAPRSCAPRATSMPRSSCKATR